MDQEQFDNDKSKMTKYIKEYRKNYLGKTDGIAKIRLLGDADEVFGNWRIQEMKGRIELVDIEDSGYEKHDADVGDHEDELKLLENNKCDIYIMFDNNSDGFHTLRELTEKDREGNAKFPDWLPENNFMPNSVFRCSRKQILKQHYLERSWCNAFIVFVIYGDEVPEDKPITEASRIILEETKIRIKTPPESYSVDYIKIKWDEYVHDHSDMYDEKFFAIITTKAIRETINWNWICTELNKEEEDPDKYENDDFCLELNYGNCALDGRHEKTNDEDWKLFCEAVNQEGYSFKMYNKLKTRLEERNKIIL